MPSNKRKQGSQSAGGPGGGGGPVLVPLNVPVVLVKYANGWQDHEKKIVAGADTTHDMKEERMNAGTDFTIVSSAIVKALNSLFQCPGPTYTDWLKHVSGGQITHSKVEDDTVEYFETNHSIKMRTHLP